MSGVPLKILFVCGKNLRRSPTAETAYRNDPRMVVRSAGVSEKSRHQITAKDLAWADLVLVMERKHRARILEAFADLDRLPRIESLEIPDDYEFMGEELIELIRNGTEDVLSAIASE